MSIAQKTTELQSIIRNSVLFELGEVRQIHQIGPYAFIEFGPLNPPPRWVQYAVYVEGEYMNFITFTLEQALVAALAFKNFKDREKAISFASAAGKILDID